MKSAKKIAIKTQKKKLSEIDLNATYNSLILEFVFNSGKFKGKDSSEVPLGYLITLKDAWHDPDSKYNLSLMKKAFSFQELEMAINSHPKNSKGTTQPPSASIAPTTTKTTTVTTPAPSTSLGRYIAGEAEKSDKGLEIGEKVIIEKIPNGWNFSGLKSGSNGTLNTNEIKGLIKSIRDEHDKPITSNNFDDLKNLIYQDENQEKNVVDQANKHILPAEKLSEEQEKIDKRFEKIISSGSNSHIVIRALAGSGKTTMLKHLAWKYGKSGQKWLYLVFNTKNKVEATEKFPPWVKVKTTNGFLGEILEHGNNSLKINQTKRMVDLAKGKDERIPSKIRILADSNEFKTICSSRFGIPDENKINTRDNTTLSIIKSIRYGFKEEVIKLSELCKSFSINPNNENLEAKIKEVFEKYDIDSSLSDIKKRISKYKAGEWLNKLLNSLVSYLGYDIRSKDFEKEIIDATAWLLKESVPGATNIKYEKMKDGRIQKFNLGEYRDFTDDLWYASIHADKLSWPKYDFVLADEVQDFNECQKIMLKKLSESGAKIVAVGDENQCQPAGTLVHLSGGMVKPIEDLKIGDSILSFDSSKNKFVSKFVSETASRPYTGKLISIIIGDNVVKCTPNHKCFVKIIKSNKYGIYLMVKGENARIGIAPITHKNGFGPRVRARQEEADKLWLLDIVEDKNKAMIMEQVISCKFKLPQTVFTSNKPKLKKLSSDIYSLIGNNIDLAKTCLENFGKLWDYPIWDSGSKISIGQRPFTTQSCNIFQEIMHLCIKDDDKGSWVSFKKLEENVENITVYSLGIKSNKNKKLYIANNLIISNSIYRFRGADSKAFNNLSNELSNISSDKNVEHSLTTNYRSRSNIINFVNNATKVKNLKGKIFEDGGEGEVTEQEKEYEDIFDVIKKENDNKKLKETAFIARTNQPLAHAALKLLSNGVPFVILGKDLASELVKHTEKIMKFKKLNEGDSVQELSYALQSYLEDETENHGDQSSKKAHLQELKETTEALLSCINQFSGINECIEMIVLSGLSRLNEGSGYYSSSTGGNTIKNFITWLKDKLSGLNIEEKESDLKAYKEKLEKEHPVILTTSHKSKGLEFDRVYILRDDQFPSPKAKREEDLEQEENAKYVAYTRAKDQLHIVKLEGQPGYVKK